jgi:threonine dehydrogenase-like Zn-dependent dehydrogenase
LKALVKHAKGRDGLGITDVAVPEIGPDDVLVEVKAAAICGTDLHIRHDIYAVEMPVTIGHEFSGVVARVGQNVVNWKTGDRVIAEGNVENCGTCFCCTGGNANLCRENRYLGIKVDGVFAQYARIPARLLHRVPGRLTFEEAALAEPAAVAIDALLVKNGIAPGDFVAILGCGPIGLLAGQVAKAAGAGRVMITGRGSAVKSRFRVARELGVFDHIVNVEQEDPVRTVMTATGGKGADVVLDTTGSAVALASAFEMVRRAGLIEVVGLGDETVEVPLARMMREVVKIHFCRGTTNDAFRIFCELADRGALTLRPLVTHTYPLAEWQAGFGAAESRDAVKTLLIP